MQEFLVRRLHRRVNYNRLPLSPPPPPRRPKISLVFVVIFGLSLARFLSFSCSPLLSSPRGTPISRPSRRVRAAAQCAEYLKRPCSAGVGSRRGSGYPFAFLFFLSLSLSYVTRELPTQRPIAKRPANALLSPQCFHSSRNFNDSFRPFIKRAAAADDDVDVPPDGDTLPQPARAQFFYSLSLALPPTILRGDARASIAGERERESLQPVLAARSSLSRTGFPASGCTLSYYTSPSPCPPPVVPPAAARRSPLALLDSRSSQSRCGTSTKRTQRIKRIYV